MNSKAIFGLRNVEVAGDWCYLMMTATTAVTADVIHEMPVLGQALPCFISFDRIFSSGKIWCKGMILMIEIKTKKIM